MVTAVGAAEESGVYRLGAEPVSLSSFGMLEFGRDGHFREPTRHLPIAAFLKQGEHTPGFCLDEVRFRSDPELMTHPGLLVLGMDGTTNAGAQLRSDLPEVTQRRQLTSGYVVEEGFEAVLQRYAQCAALPSNVAFAPESRHPQGEQAVTVKGLVSWLCGEGDDPRLKSLSQCFEMFLRDGLAADSILCLAENGLELERALDGKRGLVVPGPGTTQLPKGFKPLMFHRGFGGRKDYDEALLERFAARYLRRASPEQIADRLFDPKKMDDALALLSALHRATEDLMPGFEAEFRNANHKFCPQDRSLNARLGSTTVNGIIKHVDGSLMPFATTDSPVIVIHDDKIFFWGEIEPEVIPQFGKHYNWGLKVAMEPRSDEAYPSFCRGISYCRIPAEVATEAIFIVMSDGMLPHESDKEALIQGLLAHTGSAQTAKDFLVQFSEERWAHWGRELGKHAAAIDDRFCYVAEGAAFY